MKSFLKAIGLVILVVIWAVCLESVRGCTAPINVNVRAENWQCETELHNESGSVDFKNCEKTDGQAPVDQDATDGEDKLEISRYQPSEN